MINYFFLPSFRIGKFDGNLMEKMTCPPPPFKLNTCNFVSISFRFGKSRFVSMNFVSIYFVSFRFVPISFRILQVPYYKLHVQKVTSVYIAHFCLVNNFTFFFFIMFIWICFVFYICTVTYSGVFSVVKSELKIVLLFVYIW